MAHTILHTHIHAYIICSKILRTNNFRTVARYKIDTQKSVAFQDTNNYQSEREIKKTILFTIASR